MILNDDGCSLDRFKHSADSNAAAQVAVRADLGAGAKFSGPALVQEHGTTTVMFAGDECSVASTGELIIKVGGA